MKNLSLGDKRKLATEYFGAKRVIFENCVFFLYRLYF